MKRINRRDLLVSLACSSIILSSPSAAAACQVKRTRRNGVGTKSYQCNFGDNGRLTTTFMRVTDLLFDSAGDMGLPPELGNYEDLLDGHQLVETEPLGTLRDLLGKYSFAVEPYGVSLEFDGRGGQPTSKTMEFEEERVRRWRTLGVWDDPDPDDLPLFPLPDQLRLAMDGDNSGRRNFLRYANDQDFNTLDENLEIYSKLWGADTGDGIDKSSLGNLELLQHIGAGSVDRFVPLIFNDAFRYGGCTGDPEGGAHFNPPGLFIDVAVTRNDGTEPLRIDDFFGGSDNQERLRTYDYRTPEGADRFGFDPVTLQPGKSVMMVQRLLFGALPYSDPDSGLEVTSDRAVFGKTNLPKGVVINDQKIAFDGRSHNAVIIASYAAKGSCPYLQYWCDKSREWVLLGKVLTECVGEENAGEDSRTFFNLRTRFRLIEREHEETCLDAIYLNVVLDDHSNITIPHQLKKSSLNIGECYEFSFELPAGVEADSVVSCEVVISGFYTKYGIEKLQERAAAIFAVGA